MSPNTTWFAQIFHPTEPKSVNDLWRNRTKGEKQSELTQRANSRTREEVSHILLPCLMIWQPLSEDCARDDLHEEPPKTRHPPLRNRATVLSGCSFRGICQMFESAQSSRCDFRTLEGLPASGQSSELNLSEGPEGSSLNLVALFFTSSPLGSFFCHVL